MDLLTDLLRQAGLKRRLLDMREIGRRAVRFPCDRSVGIHVVVRGAVYLHARELPSALHLTAGDIAIMARGCRHIVSPQPQPESHGEPLEAEAWQGGGTGDPPGPLLISGAYEFWNAPIHPFFNQLPAWFVLRNDAFARFGPLAQTLSLLEDELQRERLGSETIIDGLFDVVVTYALREVVAQNYGDRPGWFMAVQDPQIRQAVQLMHQEAARDWSLEELAKRCGMSRTAFAARFRNTMGHPPLAYLRTLRMQMAIRLLSETSGTLEQVAGEVGYRDAFSFSKVFRRTVGVAPRDFRMAMARSKGRDADRPAGNVSAR
jgi:AraC-like DNA-binding protein